MLDAFVILYDILNSTAWC